MVAARWRGCHDRNMRATIDEEGRLVIPADLVRKVGLEPGQTVEVDVREDQIVVAAQVNFPHLEMRDGLPVIVSEPGTPQLPIEYVNNMIDRLRGGERA